MVSIEKLKLTKKSDEAPFPNNPFHIVFHLSAS